MPQLLCEGYDPQYAIESAIVESGGKACVLLGESTGLTTLPLVESIDKLPGATLNESEDSWEVDNTAKFVVSGVFQRWGVENANKRVYSKGLFERVFAEKSAAMESVSSRSMLGHMEHPKDGRTDGKEGAILTTGIKLVPDTTNEGKEKGTGKVLGVAEVLNTPNGRILREYTLKKVRWGVSSRGNGDVDDKGNVDEDTFVLSTFDAVMQPSTPGAHPVPTKVTDKASKSKSESVEESGYVVTPQDGLANAVAALEEDNSYENAVALRNALKAAVGHDVPPACITEAEAALSGYVQLRIDEAKTPKEEQPFGGMGKTVGNYNKKVKTPADLSDYTTRDMAKVAKEMAGQLTLPQLRKRQDILHQQQGELYQKRNNLAPEAHDKAYKRLEMMDTILAQAVSFQSFGESATTTTEVLDIAELDERLAGDNPEVSAAVAALFDSSDKAAVQRIIVGARFKLPVSFKSSKAEDILTEQGWTVTDLPGNAGFRAVKKGVPHPLIVNYKDGTMRIGATTADENVDEAEGVINPKLYANIVKKFAPAGKKYNVTSEADAIKDQRIVLTYKKDAATEVRLDIEPKDGNKIRVWTTDITDVGTQNMLNKVKESEDGDTEDDGSDLFINSLLSGNWQGILKSVEMNKRRWVGQQEQRKVSSPKDAAALFAAMNVESVELDGAKAVVNFSEEGQNLRDKSTVADRMDAFTRFDNGKDYGLLKVVKRAGQPLTLVFDNPTNAKKFFSKKLIKESDDGDIDMASLDEAAKSPWQMSRKAFIKKYAHTADVENQKIRWSKDDGGDYAYERNNHSKDYMAGHQHYMHTAVQVKMHLHDPKLFPPPTAEALAEYPDLLKQMKGANKVKESESDEGEVDMEALFLEDTTGPDGTPLIENANEVANTILQQLGGRMFVAMTGANNLVAGKNYLTFRIGRNDKGVNAVKITLDPSDTYTMTFYGRMGKVKSEFDDIYNDNLQSVFTQQTGMYTSMETMGRKQEGVVDMADIDMESVDESVDEGETMNEAATTQSGKKIPKLTDKAYTTKMKLPKYNVLVGATFADEGAAKVLRRMLPDWDKQDHIDAAKFHHAKAGAMAKKWSKHYDIAAKKAFGKVPDPTEYRWISGIGHDEFDDEGKDTLQKASRAKSDHASIARSHALAAGIRNYNKMIGGETDESLDEAAGMYDRLVMVKAPQETSVLQRRDDGAYVVYRGRDAKSHGFTSDLAKATRGSPMWWREAVGLSSSFPVVDMRGRSQGTVADFLDESVEDDTDTASLDEGEFKQVPYGKNDVGKMAELNAEHRKLAGKMTQEVYDWASSKFGIGKKHPSGVKIAGRTTFGFAAKEGYVEFYTAKRRDTMGSDTTVVKPIGSHVLVSFKSSEKEDYQSLLFTNPYHPRADESLNESTTDTDAVSFRRLANRRYNENVKLRLQLRNAMKQLESLQSRNSTLEAEINTTGGSSRQQDVKIQVAEAAIRSLQNRLDDVENLAQDDVEEEIPDTTTESTGLAEGQIQESTVNEVRLLPGANIRPATPQPMPVPKAITEDVSPEALIAARMMEGRL